MQTWPNRVEKTSKQQRQRAWYLAKKQDPAWVEKHRVRSRAYWATKKLDPEWRAAQRKRDSQRIATSKLKKKQLLHKWQKGKCALCLEYGTAERMHMDHTHKPEHIRTHWYSYPDSWRGLLCKPCNADFLPGYERKRHLQHLRIPHVEKYLNDPPAQRWRHQ